MALPADQQVELQSQIQAAVVACTERCLYFAAKWAAELLNSLPNPSIPAPDDGSDTEVDDDDEVRLPMPVANPDRKEVRLERREHSRYLLARSLFDCREYDRCSQVFLPTPVPYTTPIPQIVSPPRFQGSPESKHTPPRPRRSRPGQTSSLPRNISQKALFLSLYARYLSGEKRKNEDSETILGPVDGPVTSNREIPGILVLLEEYFTSRGGLQDLANSQGWLDYLYGLCLLKSKSDHLAKQWLLRSVNLNPFNWSAWQELATLISSIEQLQQLGPHLPRNIMAFFFHIYSSQELFNPSETVFTMLNEVEPCFPTSAFLLQQKALLYYHAKDHDRAVDLFDELLDSHPLRLDSLDVYSNILYVLPAQTAKLASLATLASTTDKFRPETNCILGNYYSHRAEHEKAVLHFRRALTLDRNFQSAWTLMGHEYIELKNLQAAVESYRRAVEIDRRDYRAWYGLGQGYEMLECPSYSLFYYQRAAALCPSDPKLWAAVANAFARCGKVGNAISAYKRALVVGSQGDVGSSGSGGDPLAGVVAGALDPVVLHEIALLYERESRWEEAAAYMELTLAQEEGLDEDGAAGGGGGGGEGEGLGVTLVTSRARLWLARWSYSRGEWQRTMELANELCQDGVEVEEAKSLVKDVRARLNLIERGEGEGDGTGEESMVRDDDDGEG